ncbi:MAG: SdrD B-like domain-containing protein [Chloroflexota bacterium]
MKLAALAPVSALFVLVSMCGSSVPAPPATVIGSVYFDANRNSVHDSCDAPLTGAQVVATSADGTRTLARVASDGTFHIDKVPSGATVVSLDTPSAFAWPLTVKTANGDDGVEVTVKGPKDTTGIDFGAELGSPVPLNFYSVQGIVFNDANANGIVDRDECLIPNIPVYSNDPGAALVSANNNNSKAQYSDGSFSITLSQATTGGIYVGQVDAAWSPTTGDPCNKGVTPKPWIGDHVYEARIGFVQRSPGGYFTGHVFDDTNGNGRRDDGEPGVSDVSVQPIPVDARCRLYNPPLVSTDPAGAYHFAAMPSGDYYFHLADTTAYPQPLGATIPRLISFPAPQTTYQLGDSAAVIDIPATVSQAAYADVFVFIDDNGDGVRNNGERFAPPLQVCLFDDTSPPNPYHEPTVLQFGHTACGYAEFESGARVGPLLPGDYHLSLLDNSVYLGVPLYSSDVTLSADATVHVEVPYVPAPTPTPIPAPDPQSLVFGDNGYAEDMHTCHNEPDWSSNSGTIVLDPGAADAGDWAHTNQLISPTLDGCEPPAPTAGPYGPILGARLQYDLVNLMPVSALGHGTLTEVIVRPHSGGLYGISLPGPGADFGQNTILFVDESYQLIASCTQAGGCQMYSPTYVVID